METESFFKNLLSHRIDSYTGMTESYMRELINFECGELDSQQLSRPVTDTEVKEVLFAMSSNKSPGPDGYRVEFFREA